MLITESLKRCMQSGFEIFFSRYIYMEVGLRMFYFPRMHEKLGARTGYDDEKVWEESGRLS